MKSSVNGLYNYIYYIYDMLYKYITDCTKPVKKAIRKMLEQPHLSGSAFTNNIAFDTLYVMDRIILN